MERLTEKQSSGYDLKAMNSEWCNKYCEQQRVETCNECGIYQAIQKLAEYENLEEQGLLFRLPCKVGSPLYRVYKKPTKCTAYGEYKDEYACQGCEKECDSSYVWDIYKYEADIKTIVCLSDEIGKTVFLTQEEAEQKLKETESD